jgi:prepilin-type N-terminal cleavage/methylation domain-containing protein/prepilin-type processing-associated H-X9-DG protein
MLVTRGSRRGFTLVELLVVIAIIGVLVSLLLPAVQSAREAARRMQCGNNLKQIALAIHNYHDTHRSFPTSGNHRDAARGRPPTNGFSWISKSLPFMEQQNLHDRLNFNLPLYAGTPNDITTNWGAIQTVIPTLLCPSDPTQAVRNNLAAWWAWPAQPTPGAAPPQTFTNSQGGPAAVTTYMGNQGNNFDSVPPQGPFERSPDQKVGFRDVLDGTANVLLLMERSPSWSPWCAWAAGNGVWAMTSFPINQARKTWPMPNSTEAGGVKYGSISLHPGGIQVAMVDGSVQFLMETMDYATYVNLGHMANGLPLGGFQQP